MPMPPHKIKNMKKILMMLTLAFVATMSVNSQTVVANIDSVMSSKGNVILQGGGVVLPLYEGHYRAIRERMSDYVLVRNGRAVTIAKRENVKATVLEVSDVAVDGAAAKVSFTNGVSIMAPVADGWSDVQPGQHVMSFTADGVTKTIRRFYTVDRKVALGDVPLDSPLPAKYLAAK